MTAAALIIAVISLTATAFLALNPRPRRRRWIDQVTHQRVLVHTTDDSSFDGVLVTVDVDAVVLADAKSLDGPEPVGLAGQQWITRDRIKFVQVVTS